MKAAYSVLMSCSCNNGLRNLQSIDEQLKGRKHNIIFGNTISSDSNALFYDNNSYL